LIIWLSNCIIQCIYEGWEVTGVKKMVFYSFILVVAATLIVSCNEGGTPKIRVKDPKVVGKGDIAIFLLIVNDGDGSDSLVGCSLQEFPVARGEMHDIIDGQMKQVKEILVPADKVVALEKGKLHLMFFGLPDELPDHMTLDLTFKKSGTLKVDVPTKRS
jgi:copper(I)-binding protein